MTDQLPEPLVAADVDLRNYPFTPMFRARLFGSSFHARVSDAGWRAGVTLWLKSWDQMPAGTLPDDDIDLCRLAELGRDMKSWKKVKAEALWGWKKCSDGLLHHKVVAEGVNEAWQAKLAQRDRTEKARATKLLKQLSQTSDPSVTEMEISVTETVTGSKLSKQKGSKGIEEESLTSFGRAIEADDAASSPEPKVRSSIRSDTPSPERSEITEAFDAYNLVAKDVGWPVAQVLTPKRRSGLRARLIEVGGIAGWRAAMAKARASPFLRGESGRDKAHETWVPDLDFLLKQSKFTNLMEGRYDERGSNSKSQGFDAIREGARRAARLDPGSGQRMGAEGDQLQRLALFTGSG